jgi:hypothetical protein
MLLKNLKNPQVALVIKLDHIFKRDNYCYY